MHKKVETVSITFENLDFVNIPAGYFGDFHISGIHTTAERVGLNTILQRTNPDTVRFELCPQVDAVLPELTQDLSFIPEEDSSLLKRIANRRDITSLDLFYDDNSHDLFYVPWEDAEDEYHNKLLHAQINNDGALFVTIQQQ